MSKKVCHGGGDGYGRINNVHEPEGGDRSDVVNTMKSVNLVSHSSYI